MDNKDKQTAQECLEFIDKSPSCFHAVSNIAKQLEEKGYCELEEKEEWVLERGGGFYVTRNDSSIIAFRVPYAEPKGFHIIASHSDFPCFKLKQNAEMTVEDAYIRLNTERYGGMILSTWLDRSLSIAGRVITKNENGLRTKLVDLDSDLLVIPNLAIHMNRDINKGFEYNAQTDMLPLYGMKTAEGSLYEKIAGNAGVRKEEILGSDLFLYVRERGKIIGADGEFLFAPRLDDLECAFASLKGFMETEPSDYVSVCAVFDNEEVGSQTKQGAASTFLKDTLLTITEAMGKAESGYRRMLADSFMISADNAHAVHPNHPEKADPTNKPYLNGGIVIKYHGGQKYTTDAYSEAVMRDICIRADVPVQTYANRSDSAGGSTLGNISAAQVSVNTVDIGLPQLAMHSAMETAGLKDVGYLVKASGIFYSMDNY